MVNSINVATQTVAVSQPVTFSSNRILTGCSALHEEGSGSFILLKPGVYRITFSGNISTAVADTAILNITANGESVPAAQIQVTTAAGNIYSNQISTYVRVYRGSVRVAVVNNSTVPVTVTNANMLVEREC